MSRIQRAYPSEFARRFGPANLLVF
jgi:hypothetical protein